ncbi:hypothetical protein JZ751_000201 [Albula glossodonta]|uniref:Uncharacterized protein n=1 Tax=Albula glossodonta TaxID=121402 RepID=A0A8T2PVK0_9TELE|nr:hypothetical protein JZ751_000201 [Albula glossodonta]
MASPSGGRRSLHLLRDGAVVKDWDPRGWWLKPQSSHSKNTIAVGPLSKAPNPTLLPGGIGPWHIREANLSKSVLERRGKGGGKKDKFIISSILPLRQSSPPPPPKHPATHPPSLAPLLFAHNSATDRTRPIC